MIFSEIEQDFINYLVNGIMASGSARSNASRINYLVEIQYPVNELSVHRIEEIRQCLRASIDSRTEYNGEAGIASLLTALRHLRDFMATPEYKEKHLHVSFEDESDEETQAEATILKTVTVQEIEARLGQGKFRKAVMKIWASKCSFTGVDELGILTASHIRPWKNCNNIERLDGNNGLLLIPNYDKLFDRGYITINPSTCMLEISPYLSQNIVDELKIDRNIILSLNDKQKSYMEFHRTEVFEKLNNKSIIPKLNFQNLSPK